MKKHWTNKPEFKEEKCQFCNSNDLFLSMPGLYNNFKCGNCGAIYNENPDGIDLISPPKNPNYKDIIEITRKESLNIINSNKNILINYDLVKFMCELTENYIETYFVDTENIEGTEHWIKNLNKVKRILEVYESTHKLV